MDLRTRELRNLCEPIGANVYFAPEAHANYATLGLAGYGPGYFCSRGASLGRPSGLVVTAAFGVFSPTIVVPAVEEGWSKTTPEAILVARYDGAVASLRRLLGEPDAAQVARAVELLRRGLEAAEGAGHPLFSGLKSLPFPEEPLGQLWRCCDMVREHRGDSHIAVWTKAMVAPVEIQLMSELQLCSDLLGYVGRGRCSGGAARNPAAVGAGDRVGGDRGRRVPGRCERDQCDGASLSACRKALATAHAMSDSASAMAYMSEATIVKSHAQSPWVTGSSSQVTSSAQL